MQTIDKATASVSAAMAAPGLLTELLEGTTGVPEETQSQLTEITKGLAGAASDLDAAVSGMRLAEATGDQKRQRASANAARGLLKSAETKKRDAASRLISVQGTEGAGASVAEIVSRSNAALAGVEKAQATARAAADASGAGASPRGQLVMVLVGAACILVPWAWLARGDSKQLLSGLSASAVIVALLGIVAYRDKNGLFGPIIGSDNRLSTSKAQIAAWTLAVGFAIAFLLARVLWEGADVKALFPDDKLDEYLVLLGGPFAAGVFAKLTVASKVDSGALQKTEAVAPTAGQLVQDDSGNVDLVDSQYLLFNLIALGYFLVRFAQTSELPEIPPFIYALTGASAASYAVNKAAQRNAPAITSVSPRTVRPGDEVRVAGVNFYAGVEDRKAEQAVVLIDGYAEEIFPKDQDHTDVLRIDIPSSLSAGTKAVTVRTAARVTTGAVFIEVVDSAPVVYGPKAALIPDTEGEILGRNFLTPGSSAADESVVVTIGGFAANGKATSDKVTFHVPAELTSDAEVPLIVVRGASSSAAVMVKPVEPG